MEKPASFSLVVPVYNEDCNIAHNIVKMDLKLRNMVCSGIINDYEIIVLWGIKKNMSILNDLLKLRDLIIYEHKRLELGSMFRQGIALAEKEYVGLITPFNQVDLNSLKDILKALKSHDMVVAFIGNHSARPWYRVIASEINTKLVNGLFGLNLKYYHLNFYRTDLIKKVKFTTYSHAAMTEAAVWLAKSGASIAQVPFVMIPHNFKSKSRVFRLKNIIDIFKTYGRLFWRIRILGERISLA